MKDKRRSFIKSNRLAQAIHSFLVVLGLRKDRELLKRISPDQNLMPLWSEGDDLSKTSDWPRGSQQPKIYYNANKRPRIMFLNSMGGSMARLSKALMMHAGVEADCYVNSFFPRKNLTHPHETNVNGVYTHEEWREFLIWATDHYDIIQSTMIPFWPGITECYEWLSERIGNRHIWRSTGLVHKYVVNEAVLPLGVYHSDTGTRSAPNLDESPFQFFPVKNNQFHIGGSTVLYSSPEKGEYFHGANKFWLPSIRDPELFKPATDRRSDESVTIYVPIHAGAKFKGLKEAFSIINEMRRERGQLNILTPKCLFAARQADGPASSNRYGEDDPYPLLWNRVPDIYPQADIVIDQFVMGSYGNTGIEGMMSGKPVVGQKRYSEISKAPVIDTDLSNLRQTLSDLLENRQDWEKIGDAGRRWAIQHHSPKAVADTAMKIYHKVLDSQP